MSILIRGMEMPTRCYACPCADLEYYDCNLMPGTRIEQHKRLDDCPLIPVPEHGRLIDADRLRHSHCAECTLYPDNCLGDECDWDSIFHIDHAPTIIPADPAKEGEG